LLHFFEDNHSTEFDLYGFSWDESLKTFKGKIENKIDCLKSYKFCVAYENGKEIPGYITEKIFNAFEAGCIPIYWGASNINDYIPQNCFISRESFKDNEELYNFMTNMTEAQYLDYLKNINNFLSSEKAQLFSSNHFVEVIIEAMEVTSQSYMKEDEHSSQ
jgi:alpha(1,3/1,4) fucosyltransferase